MPTIGIEGGRINIVPVDFVVDAIDHIAHKKGLDGGCFHLTDPEPRASASAESLREGRARPADDDAPQRQDVQLHSVLRRRFGDVARPVRRIQKQVLADLGIPKDMFRFINYPTRFDNREARRR
jgi:hypothetical protein